MYPRIQNMGGMSQRIALDLIYKDITNSSELVESFAWIIYKCYVVLTQS